MIAESFDSELGVCVIECSTRDTPACAARLWVPSSYGSQWVAVATIFLASKMEKPRCTHRFWKFASTM